MLCLDRNYSSFRPVPTHYTTLFNYYKWCCIYIYIYSLFYCTGTEKGLLVLYVLKQKVWIDKQLVDKVTINWVGDKDSPFCILLLQQVKKSIVKAHANHIVKGKENHISAIARCYINIIIIHYKAKFPYSFAWIFNAN